MGRSSGKFSKRGLGRTLEEIDLADRKKSAEVEYALCGCCPAGLFVYPESVGDVLSTNCHQAFKENFEMFLRKQKDKNKNTSWYFKLKHEQRMGFACMFCKGASEESKKRGAHLLSTIAKWADDLLEGFDEAETLLAYLKDIANRVSRAPTPPPASRATVSAAIKKVVINQPSTGFQMTVPLQTLQDLQPGQGIPTGQPGFRLVKTETGQYQIVRVGPPGIQPPTNTTVQPSVAEQLPRPSIPTPASLPFVVTSPSISTPVSLPAVVTSPSISSPVSLPAVVTSPSISTPVSLPAVVISPSISTPVSLLAVVTSPSISTPVSLPTVVTSAPVSRAPAPPFVSTEAASEASSKSQPITPDTAKVKCRNFLATLIRLASDQSELVVHNVRALIQGLIDGRVEPEVFTTKLQKELNYSRQPCLAAFLKYSLPYLQHSLATRELSLEGIVPPTITQVQKLPSVVSAPQGEGPASLPRVPLNISIINEESYKDVKGLVISAHKWVVEQLDVVLEEFKEFRDGLEEKERKKYDNLVQQQNEKWRDFDSGNLSFEELDVIIREIQKDMDDIIARHNNQNKDIDMLVELIEGKKLGAIPKKKKEKISKSKKNREKECKDTNNKENIGKKDISTLKSDEKLEQFKSETSIINIKNVKSDEEKAFLSDKAKMTDELKKAMETLNVTKAKLEKTENRLRSERSKNAHENYLLRSKLLFNDFKKHRDVLRQRQKNNFSVIDHLRASPDLVQTPSVQLALRSLHEFSAQLLLADQELSRQYTNLCQQVQTSNTVLELFFDMSGAEPPDLGSSCVNLLYQSILMSQTSPTFPSSLTSSPLGTSSPASHTRDGTQASRVTIPRVTSQGIGSLLPTESIGSVISNGAAATSFRSTTGTAKNIKPRADQKKDCGPSKLADNITNAFLERGGDDASVNPEDTSCSICFDVMDESNSFYLTLCRHRFHRACMKQWLQSPRGVSSTCPMCRTYIAKENQLL